MAFAAAIAGLAAYQQQRVSAFDVLDVTASNGDTCALMNSGEVRCWGSGSNTPQTAVGLTSGVIAIDSGATHTCFITTSTALKCWGWNIQGQLGDGTTMSRDMPVTVSGFSTGAVAVAGGAYHTCAINTAGGLKCWGGNGHGQLGDGTTQDRLTPVDVVGLSSGVVAVATGYYHTCALLNTGALKCWGWNVYGEVGDGSIGPGIDRREPVDVVGFGTGGVSAVAAGAFHTCALTTTASVRCWGWNDFGQLGDGTVADRASPSNVANVGPAALIDLGGTHMCVIEIAGPVKCAGDNAFGQLGKGYTTAAPETVPEPVINLPGPIDTLTTGGDHTCVITSARNVLCFGNGANGQLGYGMSVTSSVPVSVVGLNPKPTHTPTPTATPTPDPADTDGDGCTDQRELGPNPGLGGQRDPLNPWDYFNPTGDRINRSDDISAVVAKYGHDDGASPDYHVKYDRTPLAGGHPWQFDAPNGTIRAFDIGAAVASFGHDCA
jgi:alpha-tubulin suppressor-like RCC1 family protein